MNDANGATRREVLVVGGAAGGAVLAGCTAGGSGEASGEGEYGGWLSDTPNSDGTTVDRTDESGVTVTVGPGGNMTYDPPAVTVAAGTTVTWEWSGRGSQHDVVEEGGGYESRLYAKEGATFTHTFEEPGASKYYCTPHRNLGMKGVVDVVEG